MSNSEKVFNFRLQEGVRLAHARLERFEAVSSAGTIGVLGSDFPGVKPKLAVQEGSAVAAGDVLFTDKRDPAICVCSPVEGVVSAIHLGARRSLISLIIDQKAGSGDKRGSRQVPEPPTDPATVVRHLLEAGLWARLRQRPFGKVPLSTVRPRKLFINAMDPRTVADPLELVETERHAFHAGLDALCLLPEQETFLCSQVKLPIEPKYPDHLKQACFNGMHPAGLSGTHIHALSNPDPLQPVFEVDLQLVVDLGWYLIGEMANASRQVVITGDGVTRPGVYMTRAGTPIAALFEGAGFATEWSKYRVVAGTLFDGRRIGVQNAFLGNREGILQVLPEVSLGQTSRFAPMCDRTSWLGRALDRIFPLTDTNLHGTHAAMLPVESIERVWPHGAPVLPLLRALLTEDDETAMGLGALAFVEEDLSLASWACPGKYDYGQALRAFLDRAEQALT